VTAGLAGLLLSLALVGVVVAREVRRVAAPEVMGVRRLTLRGRAVPLWVEALLWVAAAVLVAPRVVGLLA
jgi:hypothetical protein